MPIPKLRIDGKLPIGIHVTTINEIKDCFGSANKMRIKLMNGLIAALKNMKRAGVKKVWINGSFVTDKEEPRDIDGCWEYHKGVDLMILDPLFLDDPKLIKLKYGLHFFVTGLFKKNDWPLTFFQSTLDLENKGILMIDLSLEA